MKNEQRGMVKNGCDQSGQGTLKLTVLQKMNKLIFFMLVKIQAS